MLFPLILTLLAHASFREHDTDPGPRPTALCQHERMNSCIEGNRSQMHSAMAIAAEIDGKLRVLAGDLQALQSERNSLDLQSRKASITAEMAAREMRDIGANRLGSAIFPGGPSPEEIFFLLGEKNIWPELHSAERRARLNALVESSTEIGSQARSASQN